MYHTSVGGITACKYIVQYIITFNTAILYWMVS